MSDPKYNDAEDILSEFKSQSSPDSSEQTPDVLETAGAQPESAPEHPPEYAEQTKPESAPEYAEQTKPESAPEHPPSGDEKPEDRNVIFVGVKPIMTYVSATLTQLSTRDTVTIKARGKRITHAVDVSQMIVKRMDTVGFYISDVRISSDSLESQDGKYRNVSTIEVDITKK